jgi:serine/threonine-protein kinase
MSDLPSPTDSHAKPRGRTVSRMRFVGPPGMALGDQDCKTIGRYEILQTLGKGAMGVVYKARDPLLDRTVAVKTIVSPKGVAGRVRSAYLERFQREAKAAAKMQHPAIVTIFDVGLDNGAPFMVLEFLPGESLADRLDRVRMPLARAVQIGLDLASALAFAHKQRIVHRDVKPANVLHAGEDRWKLADFGIARMPDSDLTQVGIFMGTPGYAPPEAIRQGLYTPQADVFAWGAVLYELVSGRIPYEGPDTQTTNGYVLKATARSPREYDPSIPQPMADLIMRALDPSAERRLKDGSEIETALRETWARCLKSGMIGPGSLAGEELSHEAAGPLMHDTTAAAEARAAGKGAGAGEGRGKGGEPLFIAPDKAAASDDDPTTVLVRDSAMDDGPTGMDGGEGARPDAGPQTIREEQIVAQARVAAAHAGDSAPLELLQAASRASAGGRNRLRWLLLALGLVALAGAAVYFLGAAGR